MLLLRTEESSDISTNIHRVWSTEMYHRSSRRTSTKSRNSMYILPTVFWTEDWGVKHFAINELVLRDIACLVENPVRRLRGFPCHPNPRDPDHKTYASYLTRLKYPAGRPYT